MTEAEWLTCADPTALYYQAVERLNLSQYRRDRYTFACYRLISHLIDDEGAKRAFDWLDEHPGERQRSGSRGHVRELFQVHAQALYDAHHRREDGVAGAATHVAYDFWAEWYEYAFPNLHEYSGVLYPGALRDDPYIYLVAVTRDIFGNPFRPASFSPSWLTESATALAHGIYTDRAFDRLPILADVLQEAGCEDEDMLSHCRGDGPHTRGCWVVDLVLGKT